jgi:hypothetical protein
LSLGRVVYFVGDTTDGSARRGRALLTVLPYGREASHLPVFREVSR